jgi:hypothetical protein
MPHLVPFLSLPRLLTQLHASYRKRQSHNTLKTTSCCLSTALLAISVRLAFALAVFKFSGRCR